MLLTVTASPHVADVVLPDDELVNVDVVGAAGGARCAICDGHQGGCLRWFVEVVAILSVVAVDVFVVWF